MRIIHTLFIILIYLQLVAQKHDYYWLTGAGGGTQSGPNDSSGITILNFNSPNGPEIINDQIINTNFTGTNTSICDTKGNLLFYTNGVNVYTKEHEIMAFGSSIGTGGSEWGYRLPQGAIGVPFPDHPNQYFLFTVQNHESLAIGKALYYHIIDMNLNNGLGQVVEKRKKIVQDSLDWGRLAATKHSNGRDWWVVLNRFSGKKTYIIRLTPNGIDTFSQIIEGANIRYGGAATFSPDGSKYILSTHTNNNSPGYIDIFDFDRCTGNLSNRRRHILNHPDYFVPGVAVSPNSRFLYITFDRICYQYDLTSPNIFDSEKIVSVFEDNYYYVWPLDFYLAQTAPDGRVYVGTSNGSFCIHRIRYPDRKGSDCQFIQWDLYTPTFKYYDIPTFPNYRLGPIDDSACDTLGLNNHPLSRFRWDFEDTITPLRVTFTDLSAYEPDHWLWLFGDGVVYDTTASGEVFHSFPAAGLYTVCLVVSNINSSDTSCFTIQVGETVGSTDQSERLHPIAAFPNPVHQFLSLQVQGISDWQRVDAVIYDQLGRVAGRTAWRGGTGQVNMAELPEGVYALDISVEGQKKGIVRVVKT
jgi:PKD repeat protein